MWRGIIKHFGIKDKTPEEVSNMTLDEFAKHAAADIFEKPREGKAVEEPVKETQKTEPTEQSAIFAELNDAKSQVAREKAFKKFGDMEKQARDVYDNFEDYIKKLKERAKEKGIEIETDC